MKLTKYQNIWLSVVDGTGAQLKRQIFIDFYTPSASPPTFICRTTPVLEALFNNVC